MSQAEPEGTREMPVTVWVYKGSKREETYLYLAREGDFRDVPPELVQAMGQIDLVMELELRAGRRLARADSREVMRNVAGQGYHLQLAPTLAPGACRVQ